jgi:hypothetical protein
MSAVSVFSWLKVQELISISWNYANFFYVQIKLQRERVFVFGFGKCLIKGCAYCCADERMKDE